MPIYEYSFKWSFTCLTRIHAMLNKCVNLSEIEWKGFLFRSGRLLFGHRFGHLLIGRLLVYAQDLVCCLCFGSFGFLPF